MKITKQITNPHILLRRLKEEFDFHLEFSTNETGIIVHTLPDNIDAEVIKAYIENWTEEKTDAEEIIEEHANMEESRILLFMDEFIDEKSLKEEAKQKIIKIKADNAETNPSTGN